MMATIVTDCRTCKHYRALLAKQTEARENVARSLKMCRHQNKKLKLKLAALEVMNNVERPAQ